MYVSWGSTIPSKFHVTNGVRQGGVLSLLLFNVYVNDLSECLNKSGVGGSMNGTFVNHMLYADDRNLLEVYNDIMFYFYYKYSFFIHIL